MAHRRHFLREEANELVGPLTEALDRLAQAHAVMAAPGARDALERAALVGGSYPGVPYAHAAVVGLAELARIERWGVIVRDLGTGLCDFPAMRDGRVVYLCWRLGESEVSWWHDTDTGFSGRQPLD